MNITRKLFRGHLSAFGACLFCFTVLLVHKTFAADGNTHVNLHDNDTTTIHSEKSAGLPQLEVSTFPSQLFWLAITFMVLYLIFSKKSLPEISNIIESRQEHIEGDIKRADRLHHEAEEVQKAYENNLAESREKAQLLLAEMQEDIKDKAEKNSIDFRTRADEDIMNMEKRLEKAKKESMDEMHTIAAEVASEAAKKIVGISTDVEQVKTVVKAINEGSKAKAA